MRDGSAVPYRIHSPHGFELGYEVLHRPAQNLPSLEVGQNFPDPDTTNSAMVRNDINGASAALPMPQPDQTSSIVPALSAKASASTPMRCWMVLKRFESGTSLPYFRKCPWWKPIFFPPATITG